MCFPSLPVSGVMYFHLYKNIMAFLDKTTQFCEVHFPEELAYGLSHSFDMLFTSKSSIISQFLDCV